MSGAKRDDRRIEAEGALRYWREVRGYAGAYALLERYLESRVALLGGDPDQVVPRTKRRKGAKA